MSGKKSSEHGKPEAMKKLAESKEEKHENNSEMAKEAEEQNSFQLVDFKIEDFVCPLSLDLMQDPVIAADGHSYERTDITQWFSNHNTSPLTNQPLSNRTLRPNTQLQAAIRNYQDHSLRFTATQQELHSVQAALAMERKEQERSLGTTPGESSVESVTEHKQRLERELAELQTKSRSQVHRFENEQQAAQQRLSARYRTAAAVLLGTEEKAEGKEEKKAESASPAALPALLIEATGLEVVTAASRQTLAETSLRAALNRRVLRKTLAKWTTSQSAKHKAELAAKTQGLLALDDAMHRKDYNTVVALSEKLAEADKQASTDHKRLRPQHAQLQETLLSRDTRLQGLTQAVKTSRQALDAAAQAQTVLFAKSVADLPSPVLSSASVSVPAKGVEGASVAVKAKDEVKNGTTGLLQAASSGDLPRLQWLLNNGASLSEKYDNGSTALLFAAENGKLEMVQWLLKNGASLAEKNNYGTTALLYAAQNGRVEVVEGLLKNGASSSEKDNNGATALLYAAGNGKLEMAQWLLKNGASLAEKNNNGTTALLCAAGNGKLEMVQWLLKNGASSSEKDNNGATALLFAAGNGKLEMAQWLLKNGASLAEKNNNGTTALLFAAGNGKLEMVQWLLKNGASLAEKNKHGSTAATLARTPELRAYLADYQQKEQKGKPPVVSVLPSLKEHKDSAPQPQKPSKPDENKVAPVLTTLPSLSPASSSSSSVSSAPPISYKEFICPLTRTLMKDPVQAADGRTYERSAIEAYFKQHNALSPATGIPFANTILIPNLTLKKAIASYESLSTRMQGWHKALAQVQQQRLQASADFNQASYLKQQEMSAQLNHKKTIETRLAAAMSLFESQRREHAATMQELGQKVERLDAAVAQAQSLQERKRALPLDPTMVGLLKNWQVLEAKASALGGSAAKEKMTSLDAKISAARQKNDFAEMAQLAKAALAQQQAEAEIARQRTALLQTAAALTATKSPLQRGGLFERKLLPAQAHPRPQAMLRYQNTLFEEQVVAGDGNCGFTSLGTSREEVTRLFLGCAADIMARQELADEIQGLLRENRESALHTPETRALFIALDATQIKIDNQVRELNNQLEPAAQIANPSQPFQRYGLDALIDFLGTSANPANQASVGKLCAARANLADMNRRIKEHCQSEALFKHYVTKELGGTGWLGYRSAKLFAKLKNYNVYIYRKSLNQPGTLEQVEQQETLRPINTFHLLHTDGYTHYNLLVQATPSASLSSSPGSSLPGLTPLSSALNPLSLSSSSSNGSALSSLLSPSASFFPPAPAPLSQANKKIGLPAEEKEDPEVVKEKQEEERPNKVLRQSNTLPH